MSVLQLPRLYLNGEISWDPGLANNSEKLYDPENVRLLIPASTSAEDAKKSIISELEKYGIWNYYGTHQAKFEDVFISGAAMEYNKLVKSDDPIIGKPISLKGMLVDLDAAAANGSQIFYDQIKVGDSDLGFTCIQQKPIHARWINFKRNLNIDGRLEIAGKASVVWQTEIDKSNINFFGADNSPLLSLFQNFLKSDNSLGIMIRFHTYRTLYFQNGIRNKIPQQPKNIKDLVNLYNVGVNFSNPAYSILTGSIGIWHKNDLTSMPGQRLLYTIASADSKIPIAGERTAQAVLGPTATEINENEKYITIDFGATIPETTSDAGKTDLGDLKLHVEFKGEATDIKIIQPQEYDSEAYKLQAGIIDISLADHPDKDIIEKIKHGRLAITHELSQTILQNEMSLVALAADRDVYLDEEEQKDVAVKVLLNGSPVSAGVSVLVSEYSRGNEFVKEVANPTCDPEGVIQFKLKVQRPGLSVFAFLPYDNSTSRPVIPTSLDVLSDCYINVRTLPFDNALEKSTLDDQLTWNFMYNQIFKVYDVLNPVMSRPGIDVPLNDRNRMMSLVGRLRLAMSKKSFNSYMHMPVTRDMSAGKRKIVERWCTLVENGENPEEPNIAVESKTLLDPRRLL